MTSLNQLFEKYLNNKCSDTEILSLLEYFNVNEKETELRNLILQELQRPGEPAIVVRNLDDRLDAVYAGVKRKIGAAEVTAVKKVRLWPRIAVAAAVGLAIIAAGLFYFRGEKNIPDQAGIYKGNTAPGKVGATLILADGKQIKLSDAANGEIAREAGIIVTKTTDGQLLYEIKGAAGTSEKMNTLSTAKGETYIITLPDKSKVWLNSASSLTYSAALTDHGIRKVKLEGEAYFEISKDKSHPFIVATKRQQTEVLGTHFNINSYADEQSEKTTLLEGSVKVSSLSAAAQTGEDSILKPGQQAVLNPKGNIMVQQVSVNDAVAWKNGKFVFDNESIESIMRRLVRWYDLDVVYENEAVKNIPFTGSISRYDDISKILDKITYTQNIHFKIEGRRITVMK